MHGVRSFELRAHRSRDRRARRRARSQARRAATRISQSTRPGSETAGGLMPSAPTSSARPRATGTRASRQGSNWRDGRPWCATLIDAYKLRAGSCGARNDNVRRSGGHVRYRACNPGAGGQARGAHVSVPSSRGRAKGVTQASRRQPSRRGEAGPARGGPNDVSQVDALGVTSTLFDSIGLCKRRRGEPREVHTVTTPSLSPRRGASRRGSVRSPRTCAVKIYELWTH